MQELARCKTCVCQIYWKGSRCTRHFKDGFVDLGKWLEACYFFSQNDLLLICRVYQSGSCIFIRVMIWRCLYFPLVCTIFQGTWVSVFIPPIYLLPESVRHGIGARQIFVEKKNVYYKSLYQQNYLIHHKCLCWYSPDSHFLANSGVVIRKCCSVYKAA